MTISSIRTSEIRVYLSTEEKQTLISRAKAINQSLSSYVRNLLLRRVNKTEVSSQVVCDRILLSNVKSHIMMLGTIARESNDTTNRDELLQELQRLTEIVDKALMTSLGCGNDSSHLS